LNIFTIQLPPLRERREDIPLLVDYFIEKQNKILGLKIESISRLAVERLANYEWPGNIRDLENAVQSAMILARNRVIEADHLPMRVKGYPSTIETVLMSQSEANKIKEAGAKTEKILIEETLKRFEYNRNLTSEALNISRKTLFNKMKKYGIIDN
jgi:DNA-binding NtrC family response regulator